MFALDSNTIRRVKSSERSLTNKSNWLMGILYDLTGSRNSKWWTPDRNFNLNTYISACRLHINSISKAISMFSGFNWNYWECCTTWLEMKHPRWRHKIMDVFIYVSDCRQYGNNFDANSMFSGTMQLFNSIIKNVIWPNRKWVAFFKPEEPISQLALKIKKVFSPVISMFRGPVI